jgi:hypothetical protein
VQNAYFVTQNLGIGMILSVLQCKWHSAHFQDLTIFQLIFYVLVVGSLNNALSLKNLDYTYIICIWIWTGTKYWYKWTFKKMLVDERWSGSQKLKMNSKILSCSVCRAGRAHTNNECSFSFVLFFSNFVTFFGPIISPCFIFPPL